MIGLSFASPWSFLLLLALPLLIDRRAKHGTSLGVTLGPSFSGFANRETSRSLILSLVRVCGFLLLVVALARPQNVIGNIETDEQGRDIVLVLDLSGSMQAMDFFLEQRRVDRLTALRSVVRDFIRARRGDRIGLVVFADRAYTQTPLTADTDALLQFVDTLEIGMAGQSTAIGDGLGIALKQLRQFPSASKAIVLVTDGKNNAGSLSPNDAAAIAKELNIRVHVIGIGGNEPAPFPAIDLFGRKVLTQQILEYDEATLKRIAGLTSGEYFNARSTEKLRDVYKEIDRLETRIQKTRVFTQHQELFLYPLLSGLLLLVLTYLLTLTFLRTFPERY